MLGRFFCWLGYHDWYQGRISRYCVRKDCEATDDFMEMEHEERSTKHPAKSSRHTSADESDN